MKNILISAKDLNIGGIEKALINLANFLDERNYEVTIALEENIGDLKNSLNKNIKIIEYIPEKGKNIVFRKLVNGFKRLKFILKYKNRFDNSISFATYSKTGAFMTKQASRNPILWCHADYMALYNGNKEKVKEFFKNIKYKEFSKIVFVSKSGKQSFLEAFPNLKEKVFFCNNLIDYEQIFKLAKEKIDLKYNKEITTFLNVGRHDENQKKLTRIIESAKKLKEENYNFRVIFVGDGPDTEKYINLVKKYGIEKNIIFVGKKINPYPYFKIADCMVLSSDYEGYPVVFLESYILNKPIITTDVSDFEDIKGTNGIVVKKDTEEIYNAMKYYINNRYRLKNRFNVVEYNKDIEKRLKIILKKD